MLRVGVLVSGGGTNLQAIMDAVDSGKITNAEISLVVSNNPGAYALKRAESRETPVRPCSTGRFPCCHSTDDCGSLSESNH